MKKLYFALFFALCAIAVQAQTNQIASLFHDGAVELYYGAEALESAYEAAVDGDAITLSAGTFNSVPKIEKAITIRGAGMGTLDGGEQTPMTLLSGNFTIAVPLNKEGHLTLEGLCHTGRIAADFARNMSIQKCNFTDMTGQSYPAPKVINIRDFTVLNSIIGKAKRSGNASDNVNGTYINSVVTFEDINGPNSTCNSTLVFSNCLIFITAGHSTAKVYRSTLDNCVIWNKKQAAKYALDQSSVANNCVWLGEHDANLFPAASNNGTNSVSETLDIFKANTFYELNETGLQYLGTDGKQIGIYGGNMPFTTVTTGPRIKKFEVSPTTTADGKLSVEIEVGAAE